MGSQADQHHSGNGELPDMRREKIPEGGWTRWHTAIVASIGAVTLSILGLLYQVTTKRVREIDARTAQYKNEAGQSRLETEKSRRETEKSRRETEKLRRETELLESLTRQYKGLYEEVGAHDLRDDQGGENVLDGRPKLEEKNK